MSKPRRREADQQLPSSAFFTGIGGMGMRGLARLWQAAGVQISGSDDDSEVLGEAARQGFSVAPAAEAAGLLDQAACLVYSDAVPAQHALRRRARQRNIPELAYHEALGTFSSGFRTIVVTGTHGKSSTTALLAHILTEAGKDPAALVGAPVPAWDGFNARTGAGSLLVVEGDEYREHFLTLHWQAALIVSVDFDHPDYFSSLGAVEQAYSRFLQRNPAGWVGVRHEVQARHPDIAWPTSTQTIAADPASLAIPALPGAHMRRNATLAVAAAVWCGVAEAAAAAALATFSGLGRRYERLGTFDSLPLISDYGHHPEEIAATLQAVREEFPAGRILVLWEPHTLERLQLFSADFASALARAGGVVFLPTYQPGGRESRDAAADAAARKQLLARLSKMRVAVWPCQDYAYLPTLLKRLAPDFAAGICFSAGRADGQLRRLMGASTSAQGAADVTAR